MKATMEATPEAVRLLPSTDLPGYTYVPGSDTPHPIRDPRGHSYQRKSPPPRMLTPTNWAENRHYLLALDFFNHGFYWEAHEEWERLWRASGPDTAVGKFLKGLVKLSAAGVKVRENSIHGVRRHAASAGEVFADVAAEVGTEYFCGIHVAAVRCRPCGPDFVQRTHQLAAQAIARVPVCPADGNDAAGVVR